MTTDDGFYGKNAPNSISAGAPPQTTLGELTTPRPPGCIWGILLREGEGRVERGGEGTGGEGLRGERKAFPLFLFYETTTVLDPAGGFRPPEAFA